MTRAELDVIRTRYARTTPGPWNRLTREGHEGAILVARVEKGSAFVSAKGLPSIRETGGYCSLLGIDKVDVPQPNGTIRFRQEAKFTKTVDADFCSHAHEDIKALLDEVTRLRVLLGLHPMGDD